MCQDCPFCLHTPARLESYECDGTPDTGIGPYLYRCPTCSRLFFVADDKWALDNMFEPKLADLTPIDAIIDISSSSERVVYGRAQMHNDWMWDVYITKDAGRVVAYKPGEKLTALVIASYPTKGNRPQVQVARNEKNRSAKTKYANPTTYRLAQYAWGKLSENTKAFVLHPDDVRTANGCDKTSIGDHRSNAEALHDSRNKGVLPEDELVFSIGIRRGIAKTLSRVYGKNAKKVSAVVNGLLLKHLAEVEQTPE